MLRIDATTEFGARALRRLREDEVAWLTTVDERGAPLPSPIWFLWDGETILIYSQPDKPKLRNIASRPQVSLNLDSGVDGENIVILTGAARIDTDAPPLTEISAYVEKYRSGIQRLGITPEGMAQEFNVPIRFTPERLRGH